MDQSIGPDTVFLTRFTRGDAFGPIELILQPISHDLGGDLGYRLGDSHVVCEG